MFSLNEVNMSHSVCKNVFAINNGIIVLTFHELDFTKGRGRGLHGPESDAIPVPGPARDLHLFKRCLASK